MPEPRDKEVDEPKVKVGLLLEAEEVRALEFLKKIHGDKYDGVASVLRDYSVAQAVQAHKAALAEVAA